MFSFGRPRFIVVVHDAIVGTDRVLRVDCGGSCRRYADISGSGTAPIVTEEKPAWRQEQQRTFGKALAVAEQLATMAKYITSEWYPFYQVYVHESESAQPIPF